MSDNKIERAVCLEILEIDDKATTECGHQFHLDCIKSLRNPTCPYCRSPLNCDKLTSLDLQKIRERYNYDNNGSFSFFQDEDVARPYYEDEVGEEEMNINQNTTQRINRLADQLNNLFLEFYRMSDVNLWQNETAVNYMACKLEDALGLEIGYINPSDVQIAKGVQFRFLNMLGTDIERVRSEIASLRMMI